MAELTETDLLFELVLPLFLEQRAASMARFGGTVFLSVKSDPVRTWTLTGGEKPWLVRGHHGTADLEVVLSPRLVGWILAGRVPDTDALLREEDFGVRGDPAMLERLDATWTEARSLIATLAAGSRKPRR